MPRYRFFWGGIYCVSYFLGFLELSLVSVINFEKFSVVIEIFIFYSVSSYYSHWIHVTPFVIVPQFLEFLSFFFLYAFQFWTFLLLNLKITHSFFSRVQSTIEQERLYSILLQYFFIFGILVWFLLRISISLLILSTSFVMLPNFFILEPLG